MSLSVLVVDPNASDRKRVRQALEPSGCKVFEASNGDEVVKQARESGVDVVLLEIDMPFDGYKALEALKRDARTRAIPVTMLTSRSDWESIQRSLDLGATGYLTKPAFATLLFDQLQAIVRKSSESPDEKLVDYSKFF